MPINDERIYMPKQSAKKKETTTKLVKADKSFIAKAVAAAKSFHTSQPVSNTTVLKRCSKQNLKKAIAELI